MIKMTTEDLNNIHIQRLQVINDVIGKILIFPPEYQESAYDVFLTGINSWDAPVYISDINSFEILYANKALESAFGTSLKGKLCYETFQGLDEPCSFCTNGIICNNNGEVHSWEYYNPSLKRTFEVHDKLVHWHDGRMVRFEYVEHLSKDEDDTISIKRQLLFEKGLKETASNFLLEDDFVDSLSLSVYNIGKLIPDCTVFYYDIDHINEKFTLVHEWNNLLNYLSSSFVELTFEQIPWLVEEMKNERDVILSNSDDLPIEAVQERVLVDEKQIKSICVMPVFSGDELTGVLGFFKNSIREWLEDEIRFLEEYRNLLSKIITSNRAKQKLAQLENKYKIIFENSLTPTMIFDKHGIIQLVNNASTKVFGYSIEEFIFSNIAQLCPKQHRDNCKSLQEQALIGPICDELIHIRKNGQGVGVALVNMAAIPETEDFIISFLDLSEQHKLTETLAFNGRHDFLTGLPNRAHFENYIKNLSGESLQRLGIILCDLDGLKIFNEKVGYAAGDNVLRKIANVFQSLPSLNIHMCARFGGDEFILLVQDAVDNEISDLAYFIEQQALELFGKDEKTNNITMTAGYAVNGLYSCVAGTELIKRAETHVFRKKHFRPNSQISASVEGLGKALEERDYITDGHADRLMNIMGKMVGKLGLSQSEIENLMLLGKFHDIGKIGTPDHILFKEERLTQEEWEAMKKHCEVGYRIAQSSKSLEHISYWILCHHEHWSGKGYPLGLVGEKIPLESRILSVVDSYDAMTNVRPYSTPKSHEEAIEELIACAGSQFDPDVVTVFIEIIEEVIQSDKK